MLAIFSIFSENSLVPIISNSRKVLRLDKATLSLDKDFTDAVGFYLTERKELMKVKYNNSCFPGYAHTTLLKHDSDQLCHHTFDLDHG